MKQFLFLIIAFSLVSGLSAQSGSISGKVMESTIHEPLAGATVALIRLPDSALIAGTVCDTAGIFQFGPVPGFKFYMEISFIGFIPAIIPDTAIPADGRLGSVYLEPSLLLLEAFSVVEENSTFEYHLDKQVYNVKNDILSESSSASEVLQNIPSVTVDIEGAITLRNTSNITFFINGKPSALLRRNASTVLEQMPASSIERIEIITNPSAKYRPDGVGGIINIVLREEETEGFSGQVSANIGNESRYNANAVLNFNKANFSVHGNYGFRHSGGNILFTDNRELRDSLGNTDNFYFEDGHSQRDAFSHMVSAGVNYELGDYNQLELSGNYYRQHTMHEGNSEITQLGPAGATDFILNSSEINDEFEEEAEVSFAFEHVFKNNEDHTLSIEATRAVYDEEEDRTFEEAYHFPGEEVETSHSLIRKSGNQQEIIVDYTLPLGEDAEFESGYAAEFIFDDIRYDEEISANRFLFRQQTHALYVLYGQSVEKFSFKFGLRAEQTFIDSHLKSPIDSLIPNDYFKLYPTLHLGYELSKDKTIFISYSKRVNRPDADELNPNLEYNDPRNAEAGNPLLKPEQIHSAELGFMLSKGKYTLASSLYYRHLFDAFTTIYSTFSDSILLRSSANLDTRRSGGVEASVSWNPQKKWDIDLSGNVFYTSIDASRLGYSSNKTSISGNLKAYSALKFGKGTSVQLNGFYYFPTITPQGRREAFYYVNLGMKQDLFRHRAYLTLTATDILRTYRRQYTIDSIELFQERSMRRKQTVVYLGFTWKFNNYKDKDQLHYEGEAL